MVTISYVYPNVSQMTRTGTRSGILRRWKFAERLECEYIEVPADFAKSGKPLGKEVILNLYERRENALPEELKYILHTEPDLKHHALLRWHDRKWLEQFVSMVVSLSEFLGKPASIIEIHPGNRRKNSFSEIAKSIRFLLDKYGEVFRVEPLILLENRTEQRISRGREIRDFWNFLSENYPDLKGKFGIVLDIQQLYTRERRDLMKKSKGTQLEILRERLIRAFDMIPSEALKGMHTCGSVCVTLSLLYLLRSNKYSRGGVTLRHVRAIIARKGPLPSSEIQRELVLHYDLSRDAARKRIQRSHSSGEITRFIGLKAGGYLYYLPDIHSTELVINTCKRSLDSYRPRLGRIVGLVDTFKLISMFELCRLTNLQAWVQISPSHTDTDILKILSSGNIGINPELNKILEDFKLLGIDLVKQFLISSSLDSKSANELIKKAEQKFEEEAHLLYVARNYFENHRFAEEMTMYRDPSHQSLSNKFDAIGHGGYRKKATIILELHNRRPFHEADLMGYRERIWSTMARKKFPKPVFCFILASKFSGNSLRSALEQGMRVFKVNKNLDFQRIQDSAVSGIKEKRKKKWRGRAADTQGRAFESAVERVFRRQDFRTKTRKNFYMEENRISEKKTKRLLTDIDVYAIKSRRALLIECKSAKKQIPRRKLLSLVRNFNRIAGYLCEKNGKTLSVSAIVIGYSNRLDRVDAGRRAKIEIEIITPREFYRKYKNELKGEPRWLFVD